jgi:hypothetical protein
MHLLFEFSNASRPSSCCRPSPNPAEPSGSPADDVPQRDHPLHVALLVHHIDAVDARPAQDAHHVAQRAVGGARDGRAHGGGGRVEVGIADGRRRRRAAQELAHRHLPGDQSGQQDWKDAGGAQNREVLSKKSRLRENVSRTMNFREHVSPDLSRVVMSNRMWGAAPCSEVMIQVLLPLQAQKKQLPTGCIKPGWHQ